jgi:hypothetical protein
VKTFLSQSFHGRYKLQKNLSFYFQKHFCVLISRRHLRRLAMNGLAIVSEMGRPTIFLTVCIIPI